MNYCLNWEATECGHKICCHDCTENTSCKEACADVEKYGRCPDREDDEPVQGNQDLVEDDMKLIISVIIGIVLMRKHGLVEMALASLLIWGILSMIF